MLNNKKEIEKYHLTKFLSNENLKFLVYGVEESETPDFIVNIDKKLISIEHTRLINPDLKKKESYRDKIIKIAQKKFEKKYSEKLYSLITFNNIDLKFEKAERQKYINEVFKLIEDIYLCNKKYEFRIDSRKRKARVSELIKHFSVDNTRNHSHWQHFGAYLVENIDMDWLQSVISKKEKNIERYPKEFHENWLLLVSDFGTKASTHNFNRIDFTQIKTVFDRVYLYSYMTDSVEIVK